MTLRVFRSAPPHVQFAARTQFSLYYEPGFARVPTAPQGVDEPVVVVPIRAGIDGYRRFSTTQSSVTSCFIQPLMLSRAAAEATAWAMPFGENMMGDDG